MSVITRVEAEILDGELIEIFNQEAVDTKRHLIHLKKNYANTPSYRLIKRAKIRGRMERNIELLKELGHPTPVTVPASTVKLRLKQVGVTVKNNREVATWNTGAAVALLIAGFIVFSLGKAFVNAAKTTPAERAENQAEALTVIATAEEEYKNRTGNYTMNLKKMHEETKLPLVEDRLYYLQDEVVVDTVPGGYKAKMLDKPILTISKVEGKVIARCSMNTKSVPCKNGTWNPDLR